MDKRMVRGEYSAINGWDTNPTYRSSSLDHKIIVSDEDTMNHETRHSLCGYILYGGGSNSNHDREGKGGGKNQTIRRTVILSR